MLMFILGSSPGSHGPKKKNFNTSIITLELPNESRNDTFKKTWLCTTTH